jgi:DNA repair protein RecO
VLINVQNQNIFSFYKESLQMILDQTYNDKIMVLIIMRKFFALSGGHLEVNKCIKCGNNKLKTISFKEHGMLCNLCFNSKRDKYYELPISKAIHYLFNDQYSQLTQYFHEIDFLIKILKIYIEDMLGIKIKTLIKY